MNFTAATTNDIPEDFMKEIKKLNRELEMMETVVFTNNEEVHKYALILGIKPKNIILNKNIDGTFITTKGELLTIKPNFGR